jgi:4-amino-4-deoxy-L-arabinose transferase-like glycosyltransferase
MKMEPILLVIISAMLGITLIYILFIAGRKKRDLNEITATSGIIVCFAVCGIFRDY